MRVNNLEVVGLPEASIDEPEEDVLISALNSLAGLEKEIKIEYIDISHPIPTKRRDNKRVVVVKFVSRMTKFDVLSAKKQNRNFKYKGNDIFINEHLSPINRTLFAHAAERKKALGFKFVWTKNGVTFMRKNETSQIITISKEEDLLNLS